MDFHQDNFFMNYRFYKLSYGHINDYNGKSPIELASVKKSVIGSNFPKTATIG